MTKPKNETEFLGHSKMVNKNLLGAYCPLCEEQVSANIILLNLKSRIEKDKRRYHIVKCQNCGLAFCNPVPNLELIADFYSREQPKHSLRDISMSSMTNQVFNRYRMRSVLEQFPSQGSVLDFGCGSGLFLHEMKQLGFDITGIEFNEATAEVARRLVGKTKIITHNWETALAGRKFDVVTIWHVLEHIGQPIRLLKSCRTFLKPTGLLVVEVPNWHSIVRRLFKSSYYDIGVPVHLTFYSWQTLTKALNKSGFTIRRIQYPFCFILRFSRSLRQLLISKNIRFHVPAIVLYLSVPISLVISMIGFCGTGEALRIIACPQKK